MQVKAGRQETEVQAHWVPTLCPCQESQPARGIPASKTGGSGEKEEIPLEARRIPATPSAVLNMEIGGSGAQGDAAASGAMPEGPRHSALFGKGHWKTLLAGAGEQQESNGPLVAGQAEPV